jgi:hypothetical protein
MSDSILKSRNPKSIARVANALTQMGVALAPGTIHVFGKENAADAAARRRLTYDDTYFEDAVTVCRCGWPKDAPVHHGIPREKSHTFEAHAHPAHALEDVRFIPQRAGHELRLDANPIRGFSLNEIVRFLKGETVVPIVPLDSPSALDTPILEDRFAPVPFSEVAD